MHQLTSGTGGRRCSSFRGVGTHGCGDSCVGGESGGGSGGGGSGDCDPTRLAPKRSSFSDAVSLSPSRRRRFATPAPGESEVFDKRLEDSLRDLRVMQARLSRQPPPALSNSSPSPRNASSSPVQESQSPHGSSPVPLGLRKRALSLANAVLGMPEIVGSGQSSATSLHEVDKSPATGMSAADGGGRAKVASPGGEFRRERRRASMQDAIDASKINADLYSKLYNQANATIQSIQEENLGQLNFSVTYKEETGILTVRIIQAIELQPKDSSCGLANPYCRVAVLPNRKTQTTTKIHKKTLNPEIEEEFIFEVKPQDLNWSVLEITVFDYDPCSLDDCLGQVKLPLSEAEFSERQLLWKGLSTIEKDPNPEHKIGDLMFSLSYLPAAKRLSVSVIKARNLRDLAKDRPLSDATVRVTLSMQGGKKTKRKKSSNCRMAGNPVWEEALVFNGVAEDDLRSGFLEITVCHEGVLSSTEMGRVYLGPDTGGQEYQHWWNMLKSKGASARWHRLMPPQARK